jgi:hypothetical protein
MEMRSTTGLKECDLAMPRRGFGGFEMLETTELVLEKRRSRKIGEWEGELERTGGEHSRQMEATELGCALLTVI